MSNLRFIKLANYHLQWSCSSNDDDMSACISFKHLKYLEWRFFPCKSLDNIHMGNVVVIKLYRTKLEKLWEGANKSLKKLKILSVRRSSSLSKTGNFIGLENLEELDLRECSNLKELDSSIGCLKKLVLLNLFGCKRLTRLPWKMIDKLTSLQDLYLEDCSNISNEVGILKSVRYFCENKFSSHPKSLCQLHKITSLNLSDCTKIRSIPNLPPNIEYLKADGCTKLKSIPNLPPNIVSLSANRCRNLVNLPFNISELQNLKELMLNDCLKLGSEGFTQVTGLRNLHDFRMRNCNVSQVSSGIGSLVSLWYLDLSGNTFSSLPETFNNLLQLDSLYINDCSQLELLPPLPPQLRLIEATHCGSLDVMPFDSMQNAYIFPSKAFKESRLMRDQGLIISLSEKEVPEWCNYRNNNGNVLSFVVPIQIHHTKICGLVVCATADMYAKSVYPTIYNKTKGTSYEFPDSICPILVPMMVMFHPLSRSRLVVEAGDTVEFQFEDTIKSCGLRWIYEDDDDLDSGLVLKDGRKPTLSLLSLSSEIMTGNSITELNTDYDFFPMLS